MPTTSMRSIHGAGRTSFFFVVAVSTFVGAAAADTLQGVVHEALSSNPELGAIRFNRRAIDHELTAARGLQLPTVDVRTDHGRHKDVSRTPTGIVTGGDTHWHREAQIVGSQRLFDGFEARHEAARQRNRVESARWRVMDTANSVGLRAVQSYLELRRAYSVLETARSNLKAHRALLSRVGGRVSGGRGASSDLTEAQSRTSQAEALVIEAEGRLRDADALFRAVVGRAPGRLAPAGLPAAGMPPSVEIAVAEAVSFAPSVLATQHDVTAAEAALGSAHARLMPRVNLEMSSHRGWGQVTDGDRTLDTRAMVVVRWNLFNGGIDKARIWEAKARSLEAAEISANTMRIIERETRASWNAIVTAGSRAPLLRRQVEQIRSTRGSYDAQFDAGARRLLDLLNVQSELFVAEASLRTEEFIRVYNSYRLLAAMGRLVSALGLEPPPEAVAPASANVVEGWRDGVQSSGRDLDYHLRGRGHGPAPVVVAKPTK